MKQVKFNKTICGVDFLMNVIDFKTVTGEELTTEIQSADFFQVFFIKKAKGTLLLNGEDIELQSNSILFISQHQLHAWDVDFTSFEGQLLVFQDEFLNAFFSDQFFTFRLLYFYQTKYPLHIEISPEVMDVYLEKLKEIKQELVKPKSDSVHLIRSILYYILIALNREYAKSNQIELAISLDNTAYQFRQLIEQHIKQYQRIEDYTSLMKVSRITLNKVVKAQFNVTATEFIKQRLLFEIKMKLIYTSNTVAEIARAFQFSEPTHMSRFFKQKEGITPLEFRADYQNGSTS